jgi:hypothetical protein
LALRERAERDAQAAARAAVAAQAAARAAYEAQWRGANAPAADASGGAASAPVFGAPVGQVLPSMTDAAFFEDYLEELPVPTPPGVAAEAAVPPADRVEVVPPVLPREELAILPRPFRSNESAN